MPNSKVFKKNKKISFAAVKGSIGKVFHVLPMYKMESCSKFVPVVLEVSCH